MNDNLQDQRNQIVEAYGKTVWRIALSHTRREDAAEEVFQETFLRLFEKEREFTDENHRKAWLIRTALVCCKRYQSAALKHATVSLDEIYSLASLPEEDGVLAQALLNLPEKYRLPLQLYYMEGLTPEECIAALGLRLGTFRVRLTRGKNLLKEILKGDGIDV